MLPVKISTGIDCDSNQPVSFLIFFSVSVIFFQEIFVDNEQSM